MAKASKCVVSKNGIKKWYRNGKLHRTDGPAIECVDGSKIWYQNSKKHREDGPVTECPNGIKLWYLQGQELTKADFTSIEMIE